MIGATQATGTRIPNKQHTKYALAYYLEKLIPKNSVISAIHPKQILKELLPQITKNKNCRITNDPAKADVIIVEPEGLTKDGAFFKPHEARTLQGLELVGIGITSKWSNSTPAEYDFAPLERVITEKGIFKPKHLEITVSSLQNA
jgi:hypothetical protein